MASTSRQRFRVLFFAIVSVAVSAQAQTVPTSRSPIAIETITSAQSQRDGVQIQAGTATLRIIALRDDVLRIRITPDGSLPEDASWAVLSAPRS